MAVNLGRGVEGSEDGVGVRWGFEDEGLRVRVLSLSLSLRLRLRLERVTARTRWRIEEGIMAVVMVIGGGDLYEWR